MLRLFSVLIVSALLALPSGMVAAGEGTSPAAPGKLYLDLDVGARRIDTGNFNFFFGNAGVTGKTATRDFGVGVEGTIGYVFNQGHFPAAFGENTRVELVLGFASAKISKGGIGLPNGTVFPAIRGAQAFISNPSILKIDAKSKIYDLGVRLKTDYPLAGSALTISPYVGLGFEYMTHFVTAAAFQGVSELVSLRTDLETYTGYLKAGVAVSMVVAPETTVFFSPSVAVTRAHSTLDADQFVTSGRGAFSVSPTKSFWAARIGGKVGLFTHISMVRIGVEGGLEYWTGMPYVGHDTNFVGGVRPTRIAGQGALNASASFRITIPLD